MLPSPLAVHASDLALSGQHAHALTGEQYVYEVSYRVLGTLIDWRADVQADGHASARLVGSIRLSRGQTHTVAPKLVSHMVAQAIDSIGAHTAAAG